MNLLNYINSGASRTLKSWKWVVVIWLSTLFLVSLIVLPMRAGINNVLNLSMITEKLQNGINMDVIANTGTALSVFISFMGSGLFLVCCMGFLMNVFYAGGLFTALGTADEKCTAKRFFGGGGSNFWSFLLITVINSLIIFFLALIIIGLPVLIASGGDSEGAPYITARIAAVIFLFIVPIFILVADYSRAWQSSSAEKAPFRAIGMGFRYTFRHFLSSYPVMFILILVQLFFTWEVFKILGGMKPITGGGIFLMFLLSQLLFIVKIMLRTWRYGSVTALFEKFKS